MKKLLISIAAWLAFMVQAYAGGSVGVTLTAASIDTALKDDIDSNGTIDTTKDISNDILKSVKDIKSGLVEIKNDKDGNLASTIGRKSYSTEKLLENYNYFIESIKKEKPETIKGEFIKNIYITSTMGISFKVGAK